MATQGYKIFFKQRKFNQDLIAELKTKFIAFSLIVDAAEEKQFIREEVRKWLLELKDATYEAEDVLDGIQIEYQAHQSKAVTEDQERSSSSQDPLKQEIEPKLQEILDRLEDLRRESDAFGLRKAGEESISSEKTETTSSSARPQRFEFDVFLNFRGEDVRYGFLHYLRRALQEKGIKTFYDAEDLRKGEEIETILEKISVSKMSIMIFSKDYASSPYCLEQLFKILECRETWGHLALPVYYHVPPDVVANQSGIYGEAFRRHEKKKGTNSMEVRAWRASLAEAADIAGFVLENKRPETDDIRDIVEAVKKILEEFDSEKREFYGREADKKAIIDMLISDDDTGSNPVVIPIVGMGGVGKTTLARHVYNDKAVEKQFEVRAWVCVSDRFDVTKVTKEIVKKVTETVNPCDDQLHRKLKDDNLDPLQHKLKDDLYGNKFLLVLDDFRSEDYEEWRQLLIPLRCGAKGSKIIVTTRSQEVASMVQTVPAHDLRVLQEEDCWKLFATQARLDVHSAANPPELQKIDKKIVRKCGGLPLAAKALGGVLRCQTEVEKWKEVLESEIWEVQHVNFLPALAISYIHLPSHLKRCFAYCAIFPQDYHFEKEELVALWMSEGFLVQRKGNQSMEEIGDMYFDDLVSRSLFQHSGNNSGKQWFAMHDLVHDLARFASAEFCSRLEGGTSQLGSGTSQKIGKKTHHLSCSRNAQYVPKKFIDETLFLRSFVLADELPYVRDTEKLITDINEEAGGLLSKQKELRVLSISYLNIRQLPSSIGNLKHMHHLDLSGTSIRSLPEAITALFNLEILILRNCGELVELPAEMARLINLCQLDLEGTNKLDGMPPEMGKLKKLSKLSDFVVGDNGVSSIKELGHLHNLRGTILIRGLENVKDDRDALEAILKDKVHLKVLELKWEYGSRQAEQVLERLQPHSLTESIKIWGYGGTEFPNWVGDISFSKLKELHLFELGNCIRLPPLGQLASLENLSIRGDDDKSSSLGRGGYKLSIGFDDDDYGGDDDDDYDYDYDYDYDSDYGGGYNEVLEAICLEFYGICKPGEKPFSSLKRLELRGMKNWREWSSCKGAFPVLEELELHECPKLMSVPTHFPSLKRLRIEECGMVDFESLLISTGATLETIVINGSENMKSLSPETFPNLKKLELRNCPNLESLRSTAAAITRRRRRTSDPLFFPSLTSLNIEGCYQLVSFPRGGLHAPNLKTMNLSGCRKLKSLPQGMHFLLPSLEKLRISLCPEIEFLPEEGLPASLSRLFIEGCLLLEMRCQREIGEDWPKIKRIPHLNIFGLLGEKSVEKRKKQVRKRERGASSSSSWGVKKEKE